MIRLKAISKAYNKLNVIDNLSCDFKENKITCLYGPSGCGKTTLLNIISGLIKYDGEVELSGDRKVSYIFQEDRLLPWATVFDNVKFVLENCEYMDEIVNKYLNLVGLLEYKNKYPNELSGGMKRRVSIARAFAYKSEILLMDEPFKGLDNKLKDNIIKDFLKIWNIDKRTVVFVTHNFEEAKTFSDEIFYLKGLPLTIEKVE